MNKISEKLAPFLKPWLIPCGCVFSGFYSRGISVFCELQRLLKVEQSRLSHQLRLLRFSGIIEVKEEGRWSVYSVVPGWKEHLLVSALKESLPLGTSEKEAMAQISQQSLRLKRSAQSSALT